MELRDELLARIDEEQSLRNKLERDGTLSDDYHPKREAMHISHAEWLKEVINNIGLPKKALVGDDGIHVVCRIIINAISLPEFQRTMLLVMKQNIEYPKLQSALLEDCIRLHEGTSLLYGLYSDWDENGHLAIGEVGDVAIANILREELGLPTIEQAQETLMETNELPPKNYAAKKAAYEAWRVRVGWVTS